MTSDTTKRQAEATKQQATATRRQAGRTVSSVLVDGAYASLGATDRFIAFVRSLPDYAERVSAASPKGFRGAVEQQFDSLAIRGRQVMDAISSSPATQRAVEQTRTAREQFRTAAGQLRRTAEESGKAAEETGKSAAEETGKSAAEETGKSAAEETGKSAEETVDVEAKKA